MFNASLLERMDVILKEKGYIEERERTLQGRKF